MNKFEVGARVKVVLAEDGTLDSDLIGEVGTVTNVWPKDVYIEPGYSVLMDEEWEDSHAFGSLFFHEFELGAV